MSLHFGLIAIKKEEDSKDENGCGRLSNLFEH
jgi:hypothetical protein